jgi:CDP-diacylglycerol---glycerol-3-phosphate 3-phosphatidyltransferase
MNLANKITFLRIILAFLFMGSLFVDGLFFRLIALFLFVAAMLTDLFDGKIARQRKMITNLGKLLDPLADKILVAVAFITFVELGIVSAWMVVIIISREFCVTGLRLIASSKGEIIAASRAGKHKTVSQMVVIVLILLMLVLRSCFVLFGVNMEFLNLFDYWGDFIILISMLITISMTLISGYIYISENLYLFEEK